MTKFDVSGGVRYVKKLLKRHEGPIIVTGPPASGKSTLGHALQEAFADLTVVELDHYGEAVNNKWMVKWADVPEFQVAVGTCDNFDQMAFHFHIESVAIVHLLPSPALWRAAMKARGERETHQWAAEFAEHGRRTLAEVTAWLKADLRKRRKMFEFGVGYVARLTGESLHDPTGRFRPNDGSEEVEDQEDQDDLPVVGETGDDFAFSRPSAEYPIKQVIFCGVDSVIGSMAVHTFKQMNREFSIVHQVSLDLGLEFGIENNPIEKLMACNTPMISTCWDYHETLNLMPFYIEARGWSSDSVRVYDMGRPSMKDFPSYRIQVGAPDRKTPWVSKNSAFIGAYRDYTVLGHPKRVGSFAELVALRDVYTDLLKTKKPYIVLVDGLGMKDLEKFDLIDALQGLDDVPPFSLHIVEGTYKGKTFNNRDEFNFLLEREGMALLRGDALFANMLNEVERSFR